MNKYIISGMGRFSEEKKAYLRTFGFTNFYELRDQSGVHFSIEKTVIVNNIGCMATNFKIEEDFIMDNDFNKKYKAQYDTESLIDWTKL